MDFEKQFFWFKTIHSIQNTCHIGFPGATFEQAYGARALFSSCMDVNGVRLIAPVRIVDMDSRSISRWLNRSWLRILMIISSIIFVSTQGICRLNAIPKKSKVNVLKSGEELNRKNSEIPSFESHLKILGGSHIANQVFWLILVLDERLPWIA
jgi:hypothetical protein